VHITHRKQRAKNARTHPRAHSSQVRPLGHVGKLQLAKDMAELQLAVGSSLYPLEQLGQPYR